MALAIASVRRGRVVHSPLRTCVTVDAALRIDLLRNLCLTDDAVSGSWSAIRHDVADLNFSISRTSIVFLLGNCGGLGSSLDIELQKLYPNRYR